MRLSGVKHRPLNDFAGSRSMWNPVSQIAILNHFSLALFFGEIMTTTDMIFNHQCWTAFLEHKISGGHLSPTEEERLRQFVDSREYLPLAKAFSEGTPFPLPELKTLNKRNSLKKRTVFMFPEKENIFLKFLTYTLLQYDSVFSDNLCSFRKNISVKTAMKKLAVQKDVPAKYSYRTDIHDYFASVDITLLLPKLKDLLKEDVPLYSFIVSLLTNPYAIQNGEKTVVKKGIMAGMPLSSFLANLYLAEMDAYFSTQQLCYVRYSDDIILLTDTEKELHARKAEVLQWLQDYHLTVNTRKEQISFPGETWEFLGFSYCNKTIDISHVAMEKLMSKMKRKARALLRWKEKNNTSDEMAVRAFIRTFHRKLFDNPINSEITWARWYFPIINTDRSLHRLDLYMQDCIRYIASGNYSKSRYAFRYDDMKRLGYVSLVNQFYAFKQKSNNKQVLI